MVITCSITLIIRCRHLAEESRVQSRMISCEIRRGQYCTTIDFYLGFFRFSLPNHYSIIVPYISTNNPVALTWQFIILCTVFKFVASFLSRDIPDYRANKLVRKKSRKFKMGVCCT
jgi:hypothetical protein